MHPLKHVFLGTIFSLILLFLFPQIGFIGFFIIILSTILIDIDHYLYYICKKKDWNLNNAYNWFIERKKRLNQLSKKERQKYKKDILIFHGIEFLILVILLLFIHRYFFFVFIGVLFHMLLDLISLIYFNEPIYAKISWIYNWKRNKNKESLIFT